MIAEATRAMATRGTTRMIYLLIVYLVGATAVGQVALLLFPETAPAMRGMAGSADYWPVESDAGNQGE